MEIYKNEEVHIYTDEHSRIVTKYSSLYRNKNLEKIPKSKSCNVTERNSRYFGYIAAENIDELIEYLTKQLKKAKKIKKMKESK